MRIRTMVIIIITVLLTVVVMQNTDEVAFKFLFARFYLSKLVMLLVAAFIGFLVGVLISRPGKPRYVPGQAQDSAPDKKALNTLSEEDRDYIS
ncbi:MAG: LapA family protein [Bacteroidetes bacterium]|nr:LapA family protein [Bacteroidota bacterium]